MVGNIHYMAQQVTKNNKNCIVFNIKSNTVSDVADHLRRYLTTQVIDGCLQLTSTLLRNVEPFQEVKTRLSAGMSTRSSRVLNLDSVHCMYFIFVLISFWPIHIFNKYKKTYTLYHYNVIYTIGRAALEQAYKNFSELGSNYIYIHLHFI